MDKKILKRAIKISKFYFGCKLVSENQFVDFSWNTYADDTSKLLAKLITINEKYHNPSLNMKKLYLKLKAVIFEDSAKRVNQFKESCYFLDLPSFYIKDSSPSYQTNVYNYITAVIPLKINMNYRYNFNIGICDSDFEYMLAFFSYSLPVAIFKTQLKNLRSPLESNSDDENKYIYKYFKDQESKIYKKYCNNEHTEDLINQTLTHLFSGEHTIYN